MRQTYTYAVLEISDAAYREISGKLKVAGYQHAFVGRFGKEREVIDMHGIAIQSAGPKELTPADGQAASGGNKERISA